jgi:hypothetical protein
MAGVYSELRGFVLAHRDCVGTRHADVDPFTPDGYLLSLECGCGVEFKRWVTAEEAGRRRSAPLGAAGVRELSGRPPHDSIPCGAGLSCRRDGPADLA